MCDLNIATLESCDLTEDRTVGFWKLKSLSFALSEMYLLVTNSFKVIFNLRISTHFTIDLYLFYSIFILSNGSLYITQVKQRNTGLYKCMAKGPRGPPVSLEASLRIAGNNLRPVHVQLDMQ